MTDAPAWTCTVSVWSLCEFTAKRGDLDRRFTPSATALEGQAGQLAVLARRSPGYETELALEGRFGALRVRGYGYRPYGWYGGWWGPAWVIAPPLIVGATVVAAAATAAEPAPPPPPVVVNPVVVNAAPARPDPVIYPRNGQSAQQTEIDRQECNRWATAQQAALADASVFQCAVEACMDGRGYTMR